MVAMTCNALELIQLIQENGKIRFMMRQEKTGKIVADWVSLCCVRVLVVEEWLGKDMFFVGYDIIQSYES